MVERLPLSAAVIVPLGWAGVNGRLPPPHPSHVQPASDAAPEGDTNGKASRLVTGSPPSSRHGRGRFRSAVSKEQISR